MEINTKIQPLIEDINRVLPGDFLTSTEYKRWLVLRDLDAIWDNCLRYVRDNRNYIMVGFDHATHDAMEALGCLLTMIFEQHKEKVPVFLVDLFSYLSVEKSKYIEVWKSPVCVTPEAQVPLTLESKFRMTPIKS